MRLVTYPTMFFVDQVEGRAQTKVLRLLQLVVNSWYNEHRFKENPVWSVYCNHLDVVFLNGCWKSKWHYRRWFTLCLISKKMPVQHVSTLTIPHCVITLNTWVHFSTKTCYRCSVPFQFNLFFVYKHTSDSWSLGCWNIPGSRSDGQLDHAVFLPPKMRFQL